MVWLATLCALLSIYWHFPVDDLNHSMNSCATALSQCSSSKIWMCIICLLLFRFSFLSVFFWILPTSNLGSFKILLSVVSVFVPLAACSCFGLEPAYELLYVLTLLHGNGTQFQPHNMYFVLLWDGFDSFCQQALYVFLSDAFSLPWI